jgi:hypothetical protein
MFVNMKKSASLLFVLFAAIFTTVLFVSFTQAQTPPVPTTTPAASPIIPDTLNGWAWSSNIGWVDLRDIRVNKTSGILEGYAWSPNIGWIKFHNLSDYPSGGATGEPARVNLSNGKVSGWIRACAGTRGGETRQFGADCSSMNSRTDGWDGWIELSGINHENSGVNIDTTTGKVRGMAWGSSVIGWLQFGAFFQPATLSANCSGSSDSSGNVTFRASAFGGSNNYLYDWDETEYSSSRTFVSPFSNSSPSVTVYLAVKDAVSGNVVVASCPTVTRVTNTITGECSINGVPYNPALTTRFSVGDLATFSVTGVSGGYGAPYTYKLFAGSILENFASPMTKTFDKPVETDTYVQVVDSSGGLSTRLQCGKISVIEPKIDLRIGASGPSARALSYRVKQGSAFGLKWENTLSSYSPVYISPTQNSDGYICSRSIPASSGTNWSSVWNSDIQTGGNISGLDTTETGRFSFIIRCTSTKFGDKTASVILNVVNANESEI